MCHFQNYLARIIQHCLAREQRERQRQTNGKRSLRRPVAMSGRNAIHFRNDQTPAIERLASRCNTGHLRNSVEKSAEPLEFFPSGRPLRICGAIRTTAIVRTDSAQPARGTGRGLNRRAGRTVTIPEAAQAGATSDRFSIWNALAGYAINTMTKSIREEVASVGKGRIAIHRLRGPRHGLPDSIRESTVPYCPGTRSGIRAESRRTRKECFLTVVPQIPLGMPSSAEESMSNNSESDSRHGPDTFAASVIRRRTSP